MKKLPKVLYATRDLKADTCLLASEQMFDLVEDDGTSTEIGVYRLVEVKKARKTIELK